jgi:hypothetical protein
MAQHRLTMSIRSQIDSFLEGLQELVPQRILSIFDENELELLVSGMPTIDRTWHRLLLAHGASPPPPHTHTNTPACTCTLPRHTLLLSACGFFWLV